MQIGLLPRLLAGQIDTLTISPGGDLRADDPPAGALLSGSFNPLHAGHLGMAAAAAAFSGLPVSFELPVHNADKGTLSESEIGRRAAQFAGQHTLILSCAPLFVAKARLYPGRLFVIGYDTAARLIDPRYYGGQQGLQAAFATIRAAGCRFLVAGRAVDGVFRSADDLDLPAGAADLLDGLPESAFRVDISSRELRGQTVGSTGEL